MALSVLGSSDAKGAITHEVCCLLVQWVKCCNQSHYREVPQWEIFMEQEMRFGLDLGQLRLLKEKKWTDYEQLLRSFFSLSHEQSFPLVC